MQCDWRQHKRARIIAANKWFCARGRREKVQLMYVPGRRIIHRNAVNNVIRKTNGNITKPNTQRKQARHFDPQVFFFWHLSLVIPSSPVSTSPLELPTSGCEDSPSLSLLPFPIDKHPTLFYRLFFLSVLETQRILKKNKTKRGFWIETDVLANFFVRQNWIFIATLVMIILKLPLRIDCFRSLKLRRKQTWSSACIFATEFAGQNQLMNKT